MGGGGGGGEGGGGGGKGREGCPWGGGVGEGEGGVVTDPGRVAQRIRSDRERRVRARPAAASRCTTSQWHPAPAAALCRRPPPRPRAPRWRGRRVRATPRPSQRAARDRRLAARGRRLRARRAYPQHGRPRAPGAAFHQRLSRSDADRPRAQLDPQRAAHVPVSRLARPPRPDRLARMVAAAKRRPGAACGAAPCRLLDRLCHRQPVPRLLSPLRAAAAKRAPLRAHGRADRWGEAGLERAAAGPRSLAAPLAPRRPAKSAAHRPLPGQQPLLGEPPKPTPGASSATRSMCSAQRRGGGPSP